jgi:hypothetical protein
MSEALNQTPSSPALPTPTPFPIWKTTTFGFKLLVEAGMLIGGIREFQAFYRLLARLRISVCYLPP